MDLFPSWNPVRSDTELCPVCEALIQISKEDKREVRKMVEDEKVWHTWSPLVHNWPKHELGKAEAHAR